MSTETLPLHYFMPAEFGEALLEEKRSRFIARVWPVTHEDEALAHLASIRHQHYNATHNVFAYCIKDGPTRYSDDGEPQGTSGLPTLHVFQSENITNVCCVITRYFGGTLLGAGGLVRAYSKAAKLALDVAGVSIMRQWNSALVACHYALFEKMKAIIAQNEGLIEMTEFSTDVLIQVLIPVENTTALATHIRDCSAGTVELQLIEQLFRGARIR